MRLPVALAVIALFSGRAIAAERFDDSETKDALLKAVRFYHNDVARQGGYVWVSSADLRLREGEGAVGPDTVWVQPPGTPAVGEAFLDAFAATEDPACLAAARDAAHALVNGQLHSGGWHYRIEFDPAKRREWFYLDGKPPAAPTGVVAGWEEWKKRKFKGNQTVLDDDTTQAATRFLIRFDKATEFGDHAVHAAAERALSSLIAAQYPNGGWSANYDLFPAAPPPEAAYPVKRAQYPDDWPRTWPKDFTGCYVTNDNLVADGIATMLLAAEVYRDPKYAAAARRAGDFLILAQMPEPQPAWAQQYDRDMAPVWSRAFEPPAVTGGESQGILEALLRLYRVTGDAKYLDPVPRAVAYLRRSRRADGRLARFYELKTNRPIYFERDAQGKHQPTYSDARLASGYGYVVDSKLDRIEAEYQKLKAGRKDDPYQPPKMTPNLAARAREVIAAMDARGAWVERGKLRHHEVEPEGGVIDSRTFIRNVRVLCGALEAAY